MSESQLVLGPRGNAGQAFAFGLPAGTVAVTFEAGPERHWARPVDGVAVFPFGEDATAQAIVMFVRADGSTISSLSQVSTTPTSAEVADRQISKPTAETLPQAWTFASPPQIAEWPTGGTFVRRHGRNALTGFTGPFVIQLLSTDRSDQSSGSEIAVVTVPTARADEMRGRLATVAAGGIDGDTTNPDGTTVLVWTGPAVKAADRDRVLRGLTSGFPVIDNTLVFDLDIARVWDSGNGPGRVGFPDVLNPLSAVVDDVVGTVTVDGVDNQLRAGADDLGVVRYVLSGSNASAVIDPRLAPTLLKVGDGVNPGFVPVPASTTSLSVTLDDGSTVSAQLIDVGPLSDVKLALFPSSVEHRTVASVTVG